jgi:hypothetical protein
MAVNSVRMAMSTQFTPPKSGASPFGSVVQNPTNSQDIICTYGLATSACCTPPHRGPVFFFLHSDQIIVPGAAQHTVMKFEMDAHLLWNGVADHIFPPGARNPFSGTLRALLQSKERKAGPIFIVPAQCYGTWRLSAHTFRIF